MLSGAPMLKFASRATAARAIGHALTVSVRDVITTALFRPQ